MDPKEVRRLMLIIRDRGHEVRYDPRTRLELDGSGIIGAAEAILGAVEVKAPTGAPEDVCCCTVISPGEMLTLPDNKTGPCSWGCGRVVQYRPWVTLPVVCLYCVAERPKEDQ